jgi:hypothetical protein
MIQALLPTAINYIKNHTIKQYTSSTWITEYIGHELRVANVIRTRRLHGGVQCLSYLRIGISERLDTMGLRFEKTTTGVQVIQVGQNTPFGRRAVPWVRDVLHYTT